MTNEQIRIHNAEFMTDELSNFLVTAKKSCYAGGGDERLMRDGSKRLTFQKGRFHYTDNYAGYFQAPGCEIVRWQREDGQRIWQMGYSGGMLHGFFNEDFSKQTFAFLKQMLSLVKSDAPFRGPIGKGITLEKFPDFAYENEASGNILNFEGCERIIHDGTPVFRQVYAGGLIIPK